MGDNIEGLEILLLLEQEAVEERQAMEETPGIPIPDHPVLPQQGLQEVKALQSPIPQVALMEALVRF
jgi:hypothetical protein